MQQKQSADLQAAVSRLTQQVEQQNDEIVGRQQNVEERKQSIETGALDYNNLKTKRDELTNSRNQGCWFDEFNSILDLFQLWRREDTLKKERSLLKEKVSASERDLHGHMNKQLIHGIESVREIQKELNLTGVYGPLIELVWYWLIFLSCLMLS